MAERGSPSLPLLDPRDNRVPTERGGAPPGTTADRGTAITVWKLNIAAEPEVSLRYKYISRFLDPRVTPLPLFTTPKSPLLQSDEVTPPPRPTMPSSRSVTASLLRQRPARVSSQGPRLARRSFQSRAGLLRPRIALPPVLGQRRAFSLSIPRHFADVDEAFDPRSVERERDEVDVCIVGGGRYARRGIVTRHSFTTEY